MSVMSVLVNSTDVDGAGDTADAVDYCASSIFFNDSNDTFV